MCIQTLPRHKTNKMKIEQTCILLPRPSTHLSRHPISLKRLKIHVSSHCSVSHRARKKLEERKLLYQFNLTSRYFATTAQHAGLVCTSTSEAHSTRNSPPMVNLRHILQHG